MNIDEDHLLPEREKDATKALSLAQARVLDVDMDVIRRSVLASYSPAGLLPWLAWDRSVDEYVDSWPEAVKRHVIRDSFPYHTIKGTPAALKRALAQLNFETTVTEWFEYGGEPYLFRIAFRIAENGSLNEEEFRALFRLIFAAKNVRSYLDRFLISTQVRAPAPYIAAWGPRRRQKVTLYPDEGP